MVQRQIIWNLVEGDDAPELLVRFTGLDLSNYSAIQMNVEKENSTRFVRAVTPDPTDSELGSVTWQPGDLTSGRHSCEFEFIRVSDSKRFTLPVRFPVILDVRRDLD